MRQAWAWAPEISAEFTLENPYAPICLMSYIRYDSAGFKM